MSTADAERRRLAERLHGHFDGHGALVRVVRIVFDGCDCARDRWDALIDFPAPWQSLVDSVSAGEPTKAAQLLTETAGNRFRVSERPFASWLDMGLYGVVSTYLGERVALLDHALKLHPEDPALNRHRKCALRLLTFIHSEGHRGRELRRERPRV